MILGLQSQTCATFSQLSGSALKNWENKQLTIGKTFHGKLYQQNTTSLENTKPHFDFCRSCRRLLFGEQPEGETYHRSDR